MSTTKNKVIAVSGIKNSGKTTLITKLIPFLKNKGYSIAVVKHDGHDFKCDVENTDTYKYMNSGAEATAIFSKNKYMIINKEENQNESIFLEHFKDKDIIILEGFKYSTYPKIEVIRSEVSKDNICDLKTLLLIATDLEIKKENVKIANINDVEMVGNTIIDYIEGKIKIK